MDYSLYDAHVHLDFMTNAREVALDAVKLGLRLFSNSVTPAGFERTKQLLGDLENVDIGLGAHPWWADRVDLGEFDQLLPQTDWVGEVGLDYSPKRTNHELQNNVFEHVTRACADAGGKTLSIHSVRSAHQVLSVLERTGCAESCRCIFHWYSGSTEDLIWAISMGCWFSVNEMQANTRRAKEQLKLIPEDRLLFETDLPPQENVLFDANDIVASLERAQAKARSIRRR